jgi:hypothetical protein
MQTDGITSRKLNRRLRSIEDATGASASSGIIQPDNHEHAYPTVVADLLRLAQVGPTPMFDEHSALGIAIERFCVEQAEFRARLAQGGPTPMPDGVPAD